MSAPSYSDALHEAETIFLERQLRVCEAISQDRLENVSDVALAANPEPQPEGWLKEIDGQRRQILQELLTSPERSVHSLEGILGDWLHWADQRLMEMARTAQIHGSYDPAYWELEQERALRTEILQQWWNWLHGRSVL